MIILGVLSYFFLGEALLRELPYHFLSSLTVFSFLEYEEVNYIKDKRHRTNAPMQKATYSGGKKHYPPGNISTRGGQ